MFAVWCSKIFLVEVCHWNMISMVKDVSTWICTISEQSNFLISRAISTCHSHTLLADVCVIPARYNFVLTGMIWRGEFHNPCFIIRRHFYMISGWIPSNRLISIHIFWVGFISIHTSVVLGHLVTEYLPLSNQHNKKSWKYTVSEYLGTKN